MITSKTSIRRYATAIYFILAFTISWGGLLAVVGPGGIPGTPDQFMQFFPLVIPAILAGPSLAGILLTGLVYGRVGLRDLLARLLRWRVTGRWYAVALLTAPLFFTAIPLTLSLFFPAFVPGLFTTDDRPALLQLGIAAGLGAGIFEEIGWTGFATPRLRQRYGILTTGLIVGFLWGAWHLPVNFWSSGSPTGELSVPLLLHSVFFSVGILPAFRVLMIRVYDRTGSLLVAMLMHLSLTTGNVLFVPQTTGTPLVIWSLVLAAAMWIVVLAITRIRGGQLLQS